MLLLYCCWAIHVSVCFGPYRYFACPLWQLLPLCFWDASTDLFHFMCLCGGTIEMKLLLCVILSFLIVSVLDHFLFKFNNSTSLLTYWHWLSFSQMRMFLFWCPRITYCLSTASDTLLWRIVSRGGRTWLLKSQTIITENHVNANPLRVKDVPSKLTVQFAPDYITKWAKHAFAEEKTLMKKVTQFIESKDKTYKNDWLANLL